MKIRILILSVCVIASCNPNKSSGPVFSNIELTLAKQAEQLKGKNCLKWRELVNPDHHISDLKVLLIYHGVDCSSCVSVGFEVVKAFSNDNGISPIAISSSTNVGNDKINFDFNGIVCEDRNDLVRKELDYCYTPVLIAIGKENKIIDVFFPKSHDSIKNIIMRLSNVFDSVIGSRDHTQMISIHKEIPLVSSVLEN